MHDIAQLEDLISRLSGGHSIDRKDIEAINRTTGNRFTLTDTADQDQCESMRGAVQASLKRTRAARIERKPEDRD